MLAIGAQLGYGLTHAIQHVVRRLERRNDGADILLVRRPLHHLPSQALHGLHLGGVRVEKSPMGRSDQNQKSSSNQSIKQSSKQTTRNGQKKEAETAGCRKRSVAQESKCRRSRRCEHSPAGCRHQRICWLRPAVHLCNNTSNSLTGLTRARVCCWRTLP